jgi:putative transposase
MNNHWHMMVSAHEDGAMGEFLGWVTLTHTQRYYAHHGTTGWRHVYQGRFKSFPIGVFQFRITITFLSLAGMLNAMH